ncbi:hypothetical protein Tco_0566344 [Tanacetum coccineum]
MEFNFNVDKFENASKSLNKLIESQIIDNCKKGLGYNAVSPLYTGNFMPLTLDLSFTGLDKFVNKLVVENRKTDEEVSKVVRKSNDSPIIEDWVLDSEEENVSQTKTEKKTVKPSIAKIEFVKPKQQEKIVMKTIKQVEKHRQNTHNPRGNQRNWNNMMSQRLGSNFEMFNKACYVCGSFDHLQVDCNYQHKQFQKHRMVKHVWNNAQRVNHQNFAKTTHPCAKKNMVPRAVLMKSGLISVNTARQVNIAHLKTTMNAARPMSYLFKIAHSTVKRPIHKNTTFKNSNINQNVYTVRPKAVVNVARPKAVVNAVKGNNVNAVKASAYYEMIDRGYVTFGGKPKGGKITVKGIDQEKRDNVNSTNNINAASSNEVNAVGGKTSIELPIDLNMPELVDYIIFKDDEDVGAREQTIKPSKLLVLLAFYHEENPKGNDALKDPSWLEAMQREELYNFKLQEFWTLRGFTKMENRVYRHVDKCFGFRINYLIMGIAEKKLIQMVKIHTDKNVADLLTKDFDVSRFQYLIASIGILNP